MTDPIVAPTVAIVGAGFTGTPCLPCTCCATVPRRPGSS